MLLQINVGFILKRKITSVKNETLCEVNITISVDILECAPGHCLVFKCGNIADVKHKKI